MLITYLRADMSVLVTRSCSYLQRYYCRCLTLLLLYFWANKYA